MAAPIYIDFVARGMPQFQAAMRTIMDSVTRAESNSTKVAQAEARRRVAIVDQEARAKTRIQDRAARDTELAARMESRGAERAARERNRIRERSGMMAGQLAAKQAAEEARAERAKIRAAERAAEAEIREARRAGREKAHWARQAEDEIRRIQQQSERDADRDAKHWAREREREMRVDRRQFVGAVIGGGAMAFRNAVGTARGAAQNITGTLLGLGGGFTIADAIAQRSELSRSAALLSNSAYLGKGKRPDVNSIIDRAKAASIETGVDAGALVGGVQDYVAKSADFAGGMANMKFFGQLAKATGTSLADVTKTAGILRVQNKNLSPDAMKQMLLDVVMQGKQGAVEFSDLARSAGKITRTSSSYAGPQAENQRKLLGLAQVAIRTSGSVNETATVLSNLSADTLKHSDKIGAVLGKDFLDDKGRIAKGPEEFIADVMEKTGGNIQKIQTLGFGARSIKMFQALSPGFDEAELDARREGKNPKEARKAGREAIVADMRELIGSTYTPEDLKTDYASIMNSDAEKFEQSVRLLKMVVGEQLLPEFAKLVPTLTESIPAFQRFLSGVTQVANWAMNHPFAGFAALVTGFFLKELAAAKIASTIQAMMMKGGLGPGGGGGAAGGAMGAVGAGLALGAATGGIIYKSGVSYAVGTDHAMDVAAKVRAWQRGDHERGISPEQAKKEVDEAQRRIDKKGIFEPAADLATSWFVDASDRDYKQYKSDQALVENEDLKNLIKAIQENTTATRQNSATQGKPAAGVAPGAGPVDPARGMNMAARAGQ